MRLSELMDSAVADTSGRVLGTVRDVRLHRRGGSAAFELTGLVVGRRTSMARLGYAYGDVHGPWLVAFVLRALGRHLRYVPWDAVEEISEGRVVVRAIATRHPREEHG